MKGHHRIHETGIEARQGVKVPGMTTVLFVSIAVAIIALLAVCIF
jgi:hypothetical protein